ncbi:MAG TPA: hypothetical protein VFP53_07225, partial [Sphingomicrobium sp.]|nr:hypothetical protein [Sphingomicrobium sp.]
DGPLDSKTTISFDEGTYDFTGGNDPWGGFVLNGQSIDNGGTPLDDDSPDLLLTPFSSGTEGDSLNNNAGSIGAGGGDGGQNIGLGEGVRLDFVTDLTGDPDKGGGGGADYDGDIGQRDHEFDGHYKVNDVGVSFEQGTGDTKIKIEAFDATENAGDQVLGNGSLVNITQVIISYDGEDQVFNFNAAQLSQTLSVGSTGGADDRNYTVNWVLDSPGVYHVEVTGAMSDVRITTHGQVDYEALEIEYISPTADPALDFAITGFGAATQSTDPVHFTVPVEIVDGDGDTATGTPLDITVYAVGDLPDNLTTFSTLSTQSIDSSKLIVSNDNMETQRGHGGTGNNSLLFGAVAAAGLASESLATAKSFDDHHSSISTDSEPLVSPTMTQTALSTDGGDDVGFQAISGETKTAVEDVTLSNSHRPSGDDIQSHSVADQAPKGGNGPNELPQGTDVPQHGGHSAGPAITADAVAMPSAEALAELAGAEAKGGAHVQHNEVVGKVLAESLAGGGGHQAAIDSALSNLPGHGGHGGPIAGLEPLASPDSGTVPAWHGHGLAAVTAVNAVLSMETLMLHHDAPPPAHG